MSSTKRGTLLVGSANLPSCEHFFDAVSRNVRDDVQSVPDGETGERRIWFAWEAERIAELSNVTVIDRIDFENPVAGPFVIPIMAAVDGVDLAESSFGPFRYAEEALASYRTFKANRDAGKFSPDTRFQVSIPTPMMFAMNFPTDRKAALTALERDIEGEIDRIAGAIPHQDLALQWDVAGEMIALEQSLAGEGETWERPDRWRLAEATESIARTSKKIPDGVVLGIHLCYGDPEGEHLVQPRDLRLCVDFANSCAELIDHRIDWVHMPVPIGRSDDAFFAPLADLKLAPDTELYLGLLHKEDGAEGARKRIEAASKYVADFGVGTECGMGREPEDAIDGLLALHHEAASM